MLAKLKNCCESSSGKSGATPPPYSPDSAPNLDSKHLSGTTNRFSHHSLQRVIRELAQWTGLDFCQAGGNKLVLRSDKCLNRFGDYVEK
ncbi:hypothetical protein AVEN_229337-1 [Araneus ventricosus]|uniref:Uncharacterized protein n=1 Tax=Araneus ventricosus TaxID=182803 RepID=A0A4Y2T4D9_ARAVE|nr:hypothetical protein AVEN_229337-1 [Araneus ventricosus]